MSFSNHPYKSDTRCQWLGEVPNHWSLFKIGQLFEFRNEKVNDIDYIPLSITKAGVVPQLENVAKTIHNDNRKKVLTGDIVINSRSDRRGSSGLSPLDGSCSVINHVLAPRVELDGKYMHYLFKSIPFCDEYYRWGTGIVADLWSTQKERMSQIQIPFPPINEQKKIANFLDSKSETITHLKAKAEEKLQKLKEYRSSLITLAVTKGLNPNVPMKDSGIKWLGNVPENWGIKPLKFITNNYSGGTPSKDNVDFWTNGTIPWVSAKDMKTFYIDQTQYYITEDAIKSSATKLVFKKSILMVVRSGILKRTVPIAVNNVPVTINQDIKVYEILSNNIDSEFVANYLVGREKDILFNANSLGATVDSLDSELLGKFPILLPPLKEQLEINKYICEKRNMFDKLIASLNQEIQKLDEYRSSLIAAAVTGQIDMNSQASLTELNEN
ncbi:hypothetical protein A2U94_16360 [Bacillus sp. VT 712]|uniref:restriction endonuclease subunit S n=1 Tax=Bacillaceae TaxID=186817 RepID=UPI000473DEFF|nr:MULTISPECIES: restriction endonuclease subunit S [Bacillaceae]KZB90377.1 hypothetical protein A2U94_16360 [Bacillus sp. VT 712]